MSRVKVTATTIISQSSICNFDQLRNLILREILEGVRPVVVEDECPRADLHAAGDQDHADAIEAPCLDGEFRCEVEHLDLLRWCGSRQATGAGDVLTVVPAVSVAM